MRIGYGTSVTVPVQQERWFSEMRAARAFIRGYALISGAGNYGEIQLFNPLGSGKQILVYRSTGSVLTNTALQYRLHNVALANLVGNGINLLSGGAAGAGEIRYATPLALDGTQLQVVQVLNNDPYGQPATWLFELSPGQGLLITSNVVNETICGNFYWNEV